jgi:hypothetical protein
MANTGRTYVVGEDDLGQALRVPKELIDIIVSDDVCVVLFLSNKLSVCNLVALISHELVERCDDGPQVDTLGDWFDSVLALWTSVKVICAFEDEAETFRDEANVASFTPAQEVECNLTNTVVVAHTIHGIAPAVQSTFEGVATRVDGDLGCTDAGIVCLTNRVVQVELRSKVPLAIVGVLSTNVVCV